MSQWEAIKRDVKTGAGFLKRGFIILTKSAVMEIDVIKLKFDLYSLDKRIRNIYRDIGELAYSMIKEGKKNILTDPELVTYFEEAIGMRKEKERLEAELSEIRQMQGELARSMERE